MFQACETGNLEIVQALLQAGVDVNAKDNYGRTALDYSKNYWNKYLLILINFIILVGEKNKNAIENLLLKNYE